MSEDHREILRKVYDAEPDKKQALRNIQQLVITTPEFHSTGLVFSKEIPQPLEPTGLNSNVKTCTPYKAVVHLMLYGGMDSFNLLVPFGNCTKHESSYSQYKAIRGLAGMRRSRLLPIDATGSSQPCDTYAIHNKLPVLKELYDNGEVSFIAGIGVMTEPVTKEDYVRKTRTQLFAHDKSKSEFSSNSSVSSQTFNPFFYILCNSESRNWEIGSIR